MIFIKKNVKTIKNACINFLKKIEDTHNNKEFSDGNAKMALMIKIALFFLIFLGVYIFYKYQSYKDITIIIYASVLFFLFILCISIIKIKGKNSLEKEKLNTIKTDKYFSFFSSIPSVIAILDQQLSYLTASDDWLKEFSLESIDSIIGKKHEDILPNILNTLEWKIKIQDVLKGKEVEEEDYSIDEHGNIIAWYQWLIRPWYIQEKVIGGILLCRNNITELKKLEIESTKKEKNLSYIIHKLPDGVITMNEYGVIQSYNSICETLFGYTSHEIIGKNIKQLFTNSYHVIYDTFLNKVRMEKKTDDENSIFEIEGKQKNNAVFPLELSLSLINIDDQPLLCGIVRDITERKEADRIKTEFYSSVSKELSTPLSSIRSAMALIVETMIEEIPAKIQPMLKNVLNSCERLVSTVNTILEVDKVSSGKLTFSMREENLGLLIKKSIENNKSYEEKYGVRHELDVLPTTLMVNVDAGRLMQVMDNLLSNAAKFSDKGNTVKISVYNIEGCYGVSVKNSGKEIPKELRSQIFKRYPHTNIPELQEKEGAGLGLYISKAIIDAMNGYIGFDAELNNSTTFWFELPAIKNGKSESLLNQNECSAKEKNQGIISKSPLPSNGLDIGHTSAILKIPKVSRSLILHLENDDNYSFHLAAILNEHADFFRFTTSIDARKALSKKKFDLIILDFDLPDQQSITFLNEINNKSSKPPILILSTQEPSFEWRQKVQKVLVKKMVSDDMLLANIVMMLGK